MIDIYGTANVGDMSRCLP